jgi:hypothetical protein
MKFKELIEQELGLDLESLTALKTNLKNLNNTLNSSIKKLKKDQEPPAEEVPVEEPPVEEEPPAAPTTAQQIQSNAGVSKEAP